MVQGTRFRPWVGRTLVNPKSTVCLRLYFTFSPPSLLLLIIFFSMPPPTRQFHRLSIGQMPARDSRSTRAERADPSDERLREDRDDSSEEESSEEEESEESGGEEEEEDSEDVSASPDTSTILAHSGITYDLSNLDTESEAQALVGLGEQFDVVNCRASSTGYDFQLLNRPRVHIGKDLTTCSCASFQERPEAACQHIFVSLSSVGETRKKEVLK